MEIIVSSIPIDKSPDRIKKFIQEEIRAGKLTNWKIAKIEMQLPIKDKVFPGVIYQSEPHEYPRLFTIIEKNLENNLYIMSIPIQKNI